MAGWSGRPLKAVASPLDPWGSEEQRLGPTCGGGPLSHLDRLCWGPQRASPHGAQGGRAQLGPGMLLGCC